VAEKWEEFDQNQESSLQQAFDGMAGDLGLRLEPADSGERTVGAAFVCIPLVEYDLVKVSKPTDSDDDTEIQSLILGAESLPWSQFAQQWTNFYANPHMALTNEGLVRTDQPVIDHWMAHEKFADYIQKYPPFSPRQVQVTQIQIVYAGGDRANATYRVTEQFTNGKQLAGNGAVMVVKIKKVGWRIAVTAKAARKEPS
jgi:hypothetical protein